MKKPIWPIRILLNTLSTVVYIVLLVAILLSALLLDLKLLCSEGNIQSVVSALLQGSGTTAESDEPMAAVPQNPYLVQVGDYSIPDGYIPDDISVDTLTDPSLLTDYIYDIFSGSLGTETDVTKEQVENFINESTVSDYVSEKAASYVQDALTGEENTTITVDEIMDLIEENEALLEEHFDITVTDEMKQQIQTEATRVVEEEDLNGTVRQTINDAMDQPIGDSGMTVRDVLDVINELTSARVIALMIGIDLVLMGLLLLLSYYRPYRGLRRGAAAFLTMGLFLSVIAFVLRSAPELIGKLIPDLASTSDLIRTVAAPIATVHYGTLILGVLLLVLSILWQILSGTNRFIKKLTGGKKQKEKKRKNKAIKAAKVAVPSKIEPAEKPVTAPVPVEDVAPAEEAVSVEDEEAAPAEEAVSIENEETAPAEDTTPAPAETPQV